MTLTGVEGIVKPRGINAVITFPVASAIVLGTSLGSLISHIKI